MKSKSVFFLYLESNKKTLWCLMIIFLVGILVGIIFVNHINGKQKEEIYSYINSLTENIKSENIEINKNKILMQSMKGNAIFCLIIWFLGYTLMASFLIYGAIAYKGFSIGYTASSIIATLGAKSRDLVYYIFYVITKYCFNTEFTSSF